MRLVIFLIGALTKRPKIKSMETSTKVEEMRTTKDTKIKVRNISIFLRKILMMNLMSLITLMNLKKYK